MQTDLEIDLAGKLARKNALEEDLTRLAEGNEYRIILSNSHPHRSEEAIRRVTDRIEKQEKELAELEQAGPFRVVGGKIAISPIATNDGEEGGEP
jgi:response regulator RpfG family c-di-GMP phosphodiesterase